ncbi:MULTISPECIES: YggT family protein [Wolbachia]|uniref:YggT family protein n=1 Tax=Wolbachia endosymbiont of Oeneis ivallda TaxID=3171168 RepID=A0AAU7YMS7_9RICK|nr:MULTISPECIES: YggT family protein [Wolbachia]UYC23890.1 YggT family protein [Wolbachia endosymbiont of Aedes aegypti]QBB83958.1 YggT family protein [Wolbachia pipientis wAlbB]QDW08763.1 YggT family protein [Wolbachia pipientis]QDW09957.1 YggT family protein [Wolbachia pipientis]QZA83032.1 YggT family protein [Wolbachia pipientis]
MHPIIYLLNLLLDLYSFILICSVALDLLIKLNVVNMYNEIVSSIMQTLNRLTHPPLKVIRRYIQPFNGLDLSVMILIIAIHFVKYTITYYFK